MTSTSTVTFYAIEEGILFDVSTDAKLAGIKYPTAATSPLGLSIWDSTDYNGCSGGEAGIQSSPPPLCIAIA